MRGSAEYIKTIIKTPLVIAEIGVKEGDNAMDILKGLDVDMLYLIDPYTPYVEKGSMKITHHDQDSQDVYYNTMIEKISDYKDKVIILKKPSVIAAQEFPDEFFDYVYIDGCHAKNEVYKDLESWYPKVKKGGILGGHDYHAGWEGVDSALDMFSISYDVDVISRDVDWIIKI